MIEKTTYTYKYLQNDKGLVLDRYRFAKPGKSSRPTIVFFHGGGWTGGMRDQFAEQCKRLAQLGMVAISVEYRTKNSDDVDPPVCLADAKSAMRYIRSHAKELGIDLGKFAVGGASAGGHLAAATIMCEGFDDPEDDISIPIEAEALVLFNPVTDNGPDNGYGYERIKDHFPAISPAHNIRSGLPPTLYLLGTKDNLIPVSIAESFQTKMQDCGNECQLVLYEGAVHGFFNYGDGDNPYYEETLQELISFLERLNWVDSSDSKTDQNNL